MTQDNPDSSNNGGNDGEQPTTKQHPIASALQSLEGYFDTARKNPTEDERKSHRWAIRTGKGVIAYTVLTSIIMVAAVGTAIYSREQANTAADTERRSLRAYVGIDNEDIVLNCAACTNQNKATTADFYSDENMVTFPVENYGQTPAFDGNGIVGVKDMPPGRELPSNFNYPVGEPNQREPPRAYPWVIEPRETNHFGTFMDAANINLIKRAQNHQIWLYFYGQITYVDVFGCSAKVLFCFRYIPDNESKHRFAFCPEHNEPAKDCEKPQ